MTIAKAVISAVVAAAGALIVALGTGNNQTIGDLGWRHYFAAILAVLGSGGIVWFTQNGPWHPYIKTVVAFLSAGIASLVTALEDGVVSQTELLVAFTAAVAATGLVYQIPNGKPEPTPLPAPPVTTP